MKYPCYVTFMTDNCFNVHTYSEKFLVTSFYLLLTLLIVSLGFSRCWLFSSCSGSGECVTCGDNRCGQLGYRRGRGDTEGSERQSAMVSGLVGKEVERVACGDLFTVACCKGL